MSHVRAYNSNNERIATGRWCRYTGSFFQVYPEKKSFKHEGEWRESYTLPGTTFKTEAETKAMFFELEADTIIQKEPLLLMKMKKTGMPRTNENIVWFWKRKNLESNRRSYRLSERKKDRIIEAELQKFYVKYGRHFRDCRHLAWSSTLYNRDIVADYSRLHDIIYPPAPAPAPSPVLAPAPFPLVAPAAAVSEVTPIIITSDMIDAHLADAEKRGVFYRIATPWTAEDEQRFLELQARRPTTQ
jgi:hypothetical protein